MVVVRLLATTLLVLLPLLSFATDDREVITSQDIEREKPATLMELLRRRVGVGDSSGVVTMRGVPKVAVYRDGTPMDSTVVALDGIKPQDVEKVEIYRGAASARFGADALGGAIVIATRKGSGEMHLDFIQGYNSLDSRYTRAIGDGGAGKYQLRLSLEDARTNKSFNIDGSNNPFPHLQPVEESYSTKREGGLKAGYKTERVDAGIILDYREDSWHWGRPNYYRNDTTISPKLRLAADAAGIRFSSTVGYEQREIKVVKDRGGTDATGLLPYMRLKDNPRALSVELSAEAKGLSAGLAYGLDEERSRQTDYFADELLFEQKDKVERMAAFASYSRNLSDNVSVELGGRYDRYRYFDVSIFSSGGQSSRATIVKESFNPKAAVTWKPAKTLVFRGSAATGFIPPQPSSLYYSEITPSFQRQPNPGLKPEKSLTLDAGVDLALSERFKAGLTFYFTRWFDKMESLTTPGTPTVSRMQNIGESESKGAELSIEKEFGGGWTGLFNYTLTMTEITKSANRATLGNELPNSPRHRLNLVVSWEGLQNLTMRVSARHESSQFTDSRNITRDGRGYKWKKDAWSIADISAVKKVKVWGSSVDVTLAVDNIFDERYQKRFFEKDPGRVVRGEIAWRF